jgi:hypothetical protein
LVLINFDPEMAIPCRIDGQSIDRQPTEPQTGLSSPRNSMLDLVTDSEARTTVNDDYKPVLGTEMPSSKDIKDLCLSHVLTVRLCVAVLVASPTKSPP